jgi:hypothetical protein
MPDSGALDALGKKIEERKGLFDSALGKSHVKPRRALRLTLPTTPSTI